MSLPAKTPAKAAAQSGGGLTIVILLLCLAGLGYWAYGLKRDLTAARAEIAAQQEKNGSRNSLFTENQKLRVRVAELEAQSRVSSLPSPASAGAGDATSPAQDKAKSLASLAAQMMNTPQMRNMMQQTLRRTLTTQYAPLMNQLQLSPQERERFMDLLLAKQATSTEAAMKLMGGEMDAGSRTALMQQMRDEATASENQVREMLGEDNYTTYREYTRSGAERNQEANLTTAFTQAGQPLASDQTSALMSVIAEERRNYRFTQDLNDPAADPTAVLNRQAVDNYLREQEQLQGQIAARAGAVLSSAQLEVFRKTQAAQLERMRSSMDMATQMLAPVGR